MGLYSSNKILKKKRNQKRIKLILFFCFLIVLLLGFIYWLRNPNFNINKILITKNNFTNAQNIEARVSEILKGNSFFVIPKTSALFIPRKETKKIIKQEFPEIENIDIKLKNSKEIEVKIFEYEPKAIWVKDDKKYFVNKEGNIFMTEPVLHSYDNLIVVEDPTHDLKIGENVITPFFLSNLIDFVDKLKTLDLEISQIRIPDQEVFYLDTKNNFQILIGKNDELSLVFENIKTIIENGTLNKENFALIDYIDMRFGNKIFYKLK